ncbi:uncharacterized protein FOMMEDRAFT_146129 [Fomitiporia mediterranea MF3/22]|uniref:uncharacterized protein n=1 Tax=Fomitiporia mediterranea (strain MF3/22) TaxID=694068 RepID=UPI00044099B7|nr:uncharacterized protein FOMMEDRAFT_146129 [Fomitiporia mediterranea MF3/22]EJD04050.1 hypothetical protein FOMMEDRAFT_146129 [Fomitiporia mediterranea MF3/22]
MLAPGHDYDQTPRQQLPVQPRRKGPPPSLRIDTPVHKPAIALALADSASASSSLSSANSESDFSPPLPDCPPHRQRSMRNTKKLSLTLPSAHSNRSANSLSIFSDADSGHATDEGTQSLAIIEPKRRASLASIQNVPLASRMHRKDEDESTLSPYADGPVQILPGVWLGNEENATNWKSLADRGIRAILNVAREVISPFDSAALSRSVTAPNEAGDTFYPAHGTRPSMHYLKLSWSHGQPDLVKDGFVTAMAFIDSALERGDGVLIHCQCGVSRSATVVIALVMRAAAQSLPSASSEVRALKGTGFAGAYDFVKEKSSCIGPNMLLIYQLQDYQHVLNGVNKSPSGSEHSSVIGEDEEEWSRRRRMLDEEPAEPEADRESVEVIQEAYALDRAMEERIVARKASGSSLGSSSGIGMGPAWKARYGNRKRTGSIASNFTNASIISEDLVEEDEKEALLGIGGGFDAPSISSRSHSGETTEEEVNASPDSKRDNSMSFPQVCTPSTAKPIFLALQRSTSSLPDKPPPSAPVTKTSFGFPARLPFKPRPKLRPPPLKFLPPVPSSPDVLGSPEVPPPVESLPKAEKPRRRPAPPPLRLSEPAISSRVSDLRNHRPALPVLQPNNRSVATRSSSRSSSQSQLSQLSVTTPSQTLFVFPPSPTLKAHFTPHMVTVTSSLNSPLPFAGAPTPRVSTFKTEGRRKSFIGLSVPPTPTTACSRVDARGWVGLGPRDAK